ncbi:uncharacterized protein SPPG_01800 [Spizellomyces punctatus DAOM BR117]|uniref:Guanylate-binding protein N-terminal domain-containing protein n=1 Tax=Spizellomyces punctatus (strain DAOM BR117) TaxID=645134 RepID=A0A0L0HNQ5_SPIPD|nr:uncharacterized protein SPPG_01800 [Spizellomyces punctatus DAOM BR117]KND02717.1 hypothetical protein SPPG_01800 [Spizellomyces punctatus DAOM BR117]|eukprot:XP_016610756.1 hypothetical protein SPPG_01800 [Spizellomyces punctatus DAOM BR117]
MPPNALLDLSRGGGSASIEASRRAPSLPSDSARKSHDARSSLGSKASSADGRKGGVKGFLGAFKLFGKRSKSMSEMKKELARPISPEALITSTTPVNPVRPKTPSSTERARNPSSTSTPQSRLKPAKSEPILNYLSTPPPSLPSTTSGSSASTALTPTSCLSRSSSSHRSTAIIRLVDVDSDGTLFLRREGLEHLRRIEADVFVIAAIGGSGIGKSSVLNRIAKSRKRFPVAEEKNPRKPSQQGISFMTVDPWWETDAQGNHNRRDMNSSGMPQVMPKKVLLLDTPGLEGTDTVLDRELNLLALVMLIASSVLVVGRERFDDAALRTLRAFGELPKLIDPSTCLDVLSLCLPKLVWVLLDADTKTSDDDANFLDAMLHPPNQLKTNETTEMVRAVLTKLFPYQSLYSIPSPSPKEELPPVDESADNPPRRPKSNAYRRRMERMISALGRTTDVKKAWALRGDMMALPLKGKAVANLLVLCCDVLNKSEPLDLTSLWQETYDRRWKMVQQTARSKYEDLMAAVAVPDMPMDLAALRKRHDECARKSTLAVRDSLDVDTRGKLWRRREEELLASMGQMDERGKVHPIDAFLATFVIKNYEMAIARCRSLLAKGQDEITNKIADGYYEDVSHFDDNVNRLVAHFHRTCRTPALLSGTTITSLLESFHAKITSQRTHLLQHFQERAQHAAERAARHNIIRAERERKERQWKVMKAAEDLRCLQEAVGHVRVRAVAEEARLKEEEREARRRLMEAISVSEASGIATVGVSGPPPDSSGMIAGMIGGMVGVPPRSKTPQGRRRSRSGWNPKEMLTDETGWQGVGNSKLRSTSAGRLGSSKSDNGDWYGGGGLVAYYQQQIPPVPPLPTMPMVHPGPPSGTHYMGARPGHTRTRSGPAPAFPPGGYGTNNGHTGFGGYSDGYIGYGGYR